MSFFSELRRRNVFRVGAAYVVTAWLILQVVDTLGQILELPASIPQLILAALIVGFPVAVVLAWIYELGPGGLRKDSGAPAAGFGRKIDFAIIGVLVVALVMSLATRPSFDDHVDSSVAVLPFENISGDDDNAPFAIGIHDDLLTHLSRIRSIRTISRTSMLRYADSALTIPEIAAELNVATVLEGGVQRVGDRIRINVQLIRADRDEHLWAETFDRELTASNVFDIQSEIARAIADALRAALTEDDERRLAAVPTDNIDALGRYFIGRQLLERRSIESLQAAITYFEQVTELDPSFALGWSGLADAYMLLPEYSATVDRPMVDREAKAAIAKALSLDPDLPEIKASQAYYELRFYRWEESEAIFREALEVYPDNVNVLHWLSHALAWRGYFDEAIRHARHALTVEPDSRMMQTNLAYILTDAGQFDEALDVSRRIRTDHPEFFVQSRNMFLHELRAGRASDAAKTYVEFVSRAGGDPDAARKIGAMFIAFQDEGVVGSLTQDLIDRARLGSEDLAQVLAFIGDAEGTIAALQEALPEHSGSRSVFSMGINPAYDFIRDDPRFQELLREARLAE
jgi:TolB-like protein/cytochrome c-type biogenesis protein CcmH/NrfG